MISKKIKKQLFKVTSVEQQQIDSGGKNVQDVPTSSTDIKNAIPVMPYWHFFDFGRIAVTRSNRFSYVPAHKHKFIEMNYCYSGRSIQYIDDRLLFIKPGYLLIMDRSIQQRINYARKQDILLNILLRDDYEINELINGMSNHQNLLCKFLFNCTKKNFNHDNYLLLDLNKDVAFKNIIESIIEKGINNKGINNQLLKFLMQGFICSPDKLIIQKKINFSVIEENSLYQIIGYLNNHFQNITLDSLAKHFGYNKNYLGNKIAKETHHTFKQLLQMRRLNIACNLLQNTSLSTEQISLNIGYENHSSLFRLFKDYLKITPSEYKRKINLPKSLDGDSIIPNPYFEKD